jgi:hypothetical protein
MFPKVKWKLPHAAHGASDDIRLSFDRRREAEDSFGTGGRPEGIGRDLTVRRPHSGNTTHSLLESRRSPRYVEMNHD